MKALLHTIFLFMVAAPCFAESKDVYLEREALTRLAEQIEHLQPLADYSSQQSDTERLSRFDYQKLKEDLLTIKMGIEHFLDTPLELRKLNHELSSEYLEYIN